VNVQKPDADEIETFIDVLAGRLGI